jgi:hypothetical protein
MFAHNSRLHEGDVVAAFDNQTAAEKTLHQLRQFGFRNRDIGFFVWHPLMGLKNLLDRDYALEGAIAGAVLGIVFGIWVTPVLNNQLAMVSSVDSFVALALFCTATSALLFAFLGWEIGIHVHEHGAAAPEVDPTGSFILVVAAGEDKEWVWATIRQNGGHEPPHAIAAHPTLV